MTYNTPMQASVSFLINGEADQPISPLERGLHYGDGVFRTLRVQGQVPSHWHLHYQKLNADCMAIAIPCPSATLLLADIEQLTQGVGASTLSVIKIIITRGIGQRGYTPATGNAPTRIVLHYAMPHYPMSYADVGVRLYRCKTQCIRQPSQLVGVKHLNRLENVLARMEQQDDSYFDGVLLNARAEVIECTSSNIFARFADNLLTPDLKQFGISGITRDRILQSAHKLKLNPIVTSITFRQLLSADEIIICNSLYGAFQVQKIENKLFSWAPLSEQLRDILL